MPIMASARPAGQGRLALLRQKFSRAMAVLRRDEAASIDVAKYLGVALLIVGAVVSAIIVATLAPQYIGGISNTTSAVTTSDFGNDTVNGLRGPMGLIIGIGGLFGIVALVLGVVALKKGK